MSYGMSDVCSADLTGAIAERMGFTQGALFRHFPTKYAILQAVLSWVAERWLARVDRAVDCAPSSLAALEAVFMTHVDFVAEHPCVPRMLFGELQRSADNLPRKMVQTLIGRYGEPLRRLFEAGKASGEFDPGLDVEAAALLFIGTIQGLVIQRSEGHTSEVQSIMSISYAVLFLKKNMSKDNDKEMT